jgi:hypothetical protein
MGRGVGCEPNCGQVNFPEMGRIENGEKDLHKGVGEISVGREG